MIAIGAGIIGDISVAAERGGFMGLYGGSESCCHNSLRIYLSVLKSACLVKQLARYLVELWLNS
jgi:hypothetical protein